MVAMVGTDDVALISWVPLDRFFLIFISVRRVHLGEDFDRLIIRIQPRVVPLLLIPLSIMTGSTLHAFVDRFL